MVSDGGHESMQQDSREVAAAKLSRRTLIQGAAAMGLALPLFGTEWATPAGARPLASTATYTIGLVTLANQHGYSQPLAINAGGAVAGGWFSSGPIEVIYQRNGQARLLNKAGESGKASGVNKSRTVVGAVSSGTGATQAVRWKQGKETILPTLGGDAAAALGLNDAELIVGTSTLTKGATSAWHACSWQSGTVTDLGTLPGSGDSVALAVNTGGVIVGGAFVHASASHFPSGLLPPGHSYMGTGMHAVTWTHGKPTDLGTLPGGDASLATAVNDKGTVVGLATVAGGATHAVRWDQGKITDLGTLPGGKSSGANAINAGGQIVGYAANPHPTNPDIDATLAVLWVGTTVVALDDRLPTGSGWIVQEASAINDAGQIAADGINPTSGGYGGFVLTPSAS